MLLRSAQCPFLLLFSPRTSCLAHCPGGLELQCSCFAGRNLKHSNIMYINVRAIRIKGCWYCCVVSGVFLGLARLPSSACLPGELCLLVLPSPQCLFPPELVLLEQCLCGTSLPLANGHGKVSLHPGLWESWQQAGLGPAFRQSEMMSQSHFVLCCCTQSLRKGKLLLLLLRIF